MVRHISLLILFFGLGACNGYSQSPKNSGAPHLCSQVAEIKQLPYNDASGVDAAYDALIQAGDAVVPCLIQKITDTTRRRDPRCPAFSDRTTVGDVAYFVLIDITKLGFAELLPANLQERYKTEGAFVFEEYIHRKGARRLLQGRLREWYRRKHNT